MGKSKKMSFWQVVKRFFEPVKSYPKEFFQVIFSSTIDGFIIIISIKIIELAIREIEKGDREAFIYFIWIFFVVIFFLYLLTYFLRYRSRNYFPKTKQWLEAKYLKKYIQMENNEAENLGTGKSLSIIQTGISYWLNIYKSLFGGGIQRVSILLFSLIYIGFSIGWYVLFFIFGGIIIFIFIEKLNKFAISARNKRRDEEYNSTKNLVKIIHSKFEILQNNKLEAELSIASNFWDRRYIHHKKTIDSMRVILSMPIFIISMVTGIIVYAVGSNVIISGKGFAELTALVGIMTLFNKAVLDLLHFYRETTKDWSYIIKLTDIFDDNYKSSLKIENGSYFTYKSGNIKIQNMNFSYDKSTVFQNFSLTIQGGTKTAFVGESGGGKTTLIKLLAGYIRPDSGEIEIDGQKLFSDNQTDSDNETGLISSSSETGNLADRSADCSKSQHGQSSLEETISLQSYYKHIGYLTQDPSVFDGTIYENLVYALDAEYEKTSSFRARLDETIKLAKCEFIYDFEKGLETEIGERGVRLSGGQKQRLAIAKIMLKNPNIILLDEPTSALDSFNEEQISIALHNLFQGKTVIVVAHRLQTVKQADRILLFEQGKILEEGIHDELVKLGGKYKKMLDLQSGF